jgi:hypothetical protein
LVGLQDLPQFRKHRASRLAALVECVSPFAADVRHALVERLAILGRELHDGNTGGLQLRIFGFDGRIGKFAATARRSLARCRHGFLDIGGELLPVRIADRVGHDGAAEAFPVGRRLEIAREIVGHDRRDAHESAVDRAARHRLVDFGSRDTDRDCTETFDRQVRHEPERSQLLPFEAFQRLIGLG